MTHHTNSVLNKVFTQSLVTGMPIIRKARSLLKLQSWLIVAVSALLLAGMTASAQEVYKAKTNTSHKYDILFINKSGAGDSVGAYHSDNRDKVYEHENATKTIEWALSKARITVLTEGTYVVGETKSPPGRFGVKIDTDGSSLIIGPNAELKGPGDGEWITVVVVSKADNVNIFNLGTVGTGNTNKGNRGIGIFYEVHKGKYGIDGGIMFGSGRMIEANAGYWMVDTENMKIPLLWSEAHMNCVLGMEGVYDTEIGTIAQLITGKGKGEGEAVDMNMSCKRLDFEHVIGSAPTPGDEIVDINNSEYITVDKITALQGTGFDGALLVGYDLYGHSGMRMKMRPRVPRQKGHIIKKADRIRKEVKTYRREVSYPGFPDSLPTLRVKARLIAEFEDGSELELLNKRYQFDL